MQLPSTDLFTFSELTLQDASFLHKLRSYPEVAQYNTIGIPKSEEETKASLIKELLPKEPLHQVWIVHLNKVGPIGELGIKFKPLRYKGAEIHYSLSPAHWNKGYATSCVKHLLKHAFSELNMHRIEAGVSTNNVGSIRVLEKVGMLKEGCHRKILPLASGWSDNFTFAILSTDWQKLNQ